jgi:hypothetical protein
LRVDGFRVYISGLRVEGFRVYISGLRVEGFSDMSERDKLSSNKAFSCVLMYL